MPWLDQLFPARACVGRHHLGHGVSREVLAGAKLTQGRQLNGNRRHRWNNRRAREQNMAPSSQPVDNGSAGYIHAIAIKRRRRWHASRRATPRMGRFPADHSKACEPRASFRGAALWRGRASRRKFAVPERFRRDSDGVACELTPDPGQGLGVRTPGVRSGCHQVHRSDIRIESHSEPRTLSGNGGCCGANLWPRHSRARRSGQTRAGAVVHAMPTDLCSGDLNRHR